MPITWQNINAPSSRDVMVGLSQAQSGISGAFDKLSNLVGEQQGINQAAVDRKDSSLVLDLKTALSNAKTPEEVAALSGQLNGIRANLITNRGREAVLGAEDARTTAVQGQMTAANAFKDAQSLNRNQAIIGQYQALHAQGRGDEAEALIAPVKDQIPGFGTLATNAIKANQGTKVFEDTLLTAANQRTVSQSNANAATSNAASAAITANTGVTNAATQARQVDAQLLERLGGDPGGGRGGKGGANGEYSSLDGSSANIGLGLTALWGKDNPDKVRTMSRMHSLALEHAKPEIAGQLRELPPDVVLNILKKHSTDFGTGAWNPMDLGVPGDIQKDMIKALDNPSVKAEMSYMDGRRALSAKRVKEQEILRDELIGKLFPGIKPSGRDSANAPEDMDPPIPEKLLGGPKDVPMPIPAQALPNPLKATLRLNNPPDSAAGRYEQRQFDQVLQKREKAAAVVEQARSMATSLLEKGDPAALNDFQATPEFGLLDRDTKAKIYWQVHGKKPN
jgi:hypothetical protein